MREKLSISSKGGAGFLMLTIALVNAGNYFINLVLGRVLGPADFAEAGLLATVVLILSFIAIGIQMTTAQFVSAVEAVENKTTVHQLFGWIRNRALAMGFILAAILVVSASQLKDFLHFHSFWSFIIIASGIPVYFLLSARRGFLQGQQMFFSLSISYIIEMLIRMIVTFCGTAFVAFYSIGGYTESVALGFLFAFATSTFFSRQKSNATYSPIAIDEKKEILLYFVLIMSYELTQIVISYSDVILVKHYFSDFEAGLYTALSLAGKIVYFGTWVIVMILVPKVVEREKQGLPHMHLFITSFALIAGTGLFITIGSALFQDLLVMLLFGAEYIDIAPLLWRYSAATTLFACANVFAYYHLTLGRYLPVLFSIIAGLFQIILINFYHSGLLQIIHIQIALMGCLLLAMIIYHLIKYIQNEKNKDCTRFSLSPQ